MVCNNLLLKQLVKYKYKSKGFTVLADETTDISNKEQLTICARYDYTVAMSGRFNGVEAQIRNDLPMALYMHCASHCLNLAISYSCNVADIRNSMRIM